MIRPYFKHDVNSLANNEKLKALVRKHGAKGYAVFFIMLEHLYKTEGKPVSKLAVEMISEDLKMKPAEFGQILEYAASDDCCHLFMKTEDGLYYSDEVQVAINMNIELSKKRAEAGLKGGRRSKKDEQK